MDLKFWTAGKTISKANTPRSVQFLILSRMMFEPEQVNEVTPFLLNLVAPTEEAKMNTANVLTAQVVSVYFKPRLTVSSSHLFRHRMDTTSIQPCAFAMSGRIPVRRRHTWRRGTHIHQVRLRSHHSFII